MFRIVTLEREFGTGAGAIAAELARRLGWKLWDQQLTSGDCAARAGDGNRRRALWMSVSTVASTGCQGLLARQLRRSFPLADSHAFDTDRMMAMMAEIMGSIAAEGNAVIVAEVALFPARARRYFSCFCLRFTRRKNSPPAGDGQEPEDAEDLVDNVDKERVAYIKHYFNADWPTRSLYHLMINTAIGDEKVIATILHGMERLTAHPAETRLRGVR